MSSAAVFFGALSENCTLVTEIWLPRFANSAALPPWLPLTSPPSIVTLQPAVVA